MSEVTPQVDGGALACKSRDRNLRPAPCQGGLSQPRSKAWELVFLAIDKEEETILGFEAKKTLLICLFIPHIFIELFGCVRES